MQAVPLGRIYEDGGFRYFIQVHECGKKNRSKVKVKKWLGIPDIRQYEAFVLAWHDHLKKVGSQVKQAREEARMKELTMSVLKLFYLLPYEKEDFTVSSGSGCPGRSERAGFLFTAIPRISSHPSPLRGSGPAPCGAEAAHEGG